jgi:hypothetical protein
VKSANANEVVAAVMDADKRDVVVDQRFEVLLDD